MSAIDIRQRLDEGRAPTIAQYEAAIADKASILDMTGRDDWAARKRAAEAIRERRPALADAILEAPARPGAPPVRWLRVVASDGSVLADRQWFPWDPPDLAEALVKAHEEAAKEGAPEPVREVRR